MVTITDVIQGIFPTVFMTGFGFGFMLSSSIYAIVAAVKFFVRTIKS